MSDFLGMYTLDPNGIPIPCFDTLEWAKWYECSDNRRVRKDHVEGYFISTVFLALDHAFAGGDPILYETMVFPPKGDEMDDWCVMHRYSTKSEAIHGHESVVTWLMMEVAKAAEITREKIKLVMETS